MWRNWFFTLPNGSLFGKKSAVLLLLALVLISSEGCSKKMPCPDVNQPTAKASKGKKKKKAAKVKKTDDDQEDLDNMETATASIEEPSDEKATQKAAISTKKNKYNKNGLLQKKKYKRLRSKPGRKKNRKSSGLFSGKNKSKKQKATKSKQNVGPVDDVL